MYWSHPTIQRAEKGTNEEPKRFEMFIVTRTSQKRKELDEATQNAIKRFKVGKLLVKQKRKLSSPYLIKNNQAGLGELGDVREEVHGLRNMVKLLLQRSDPEMRPEEVEALLQNAHHSPVNVNSGHGSTHASNIIW
ncbi:hypothetical protein PIB30_084547 [Stylosanthes scabra]|uniref:Uncharacterized protein n=1 Tax=Stylosanthes scabra TaxID=79078 RepID=A0ABU6RT20_9FABA|nr:hypothetical protein [Stylosanthes scabra]